jgi:pimeloyl-ACP methyl ester carboxylesterase
MGELRVPVEGGELVGEVAGEGPPLLLLHGGPGLADYTAGLAAELGRDWTVARYTQRGTEPSVIEGDVTVAGHVADVISVLEHLGWERPVLAGHSWGGHLALHVLGRHADRFAGGVVLDPLGGVGDGGRAPFEAALMSRLPDANRPRFEELVALEEELGGLGAEEDREALALLWPAYFPDPASAPPMPKIGMSTRGSEMFASQAESLPSLEPLLSGLEVPVLFVHGSASPMPVSASADTAAVVPDATLRVLDGAGHFLWMDRPGAVVDEVAAWVSRSASAR